MLAETEETEINSPGMTDYKLLQAYLQGGKRKDIMEKFQRIILSTVAGFEMSTVNTELSHLQVLKTHAIAPPVLVEPSPIVKKKDLE